MTEAIQFLLDHNYPIGVPLTKGYVTWVDGEDLSLVLASGPWQTLARKSGRYAYNNKRGQLVKYLHRVIMPECPDEVDHRDNDGLNNRKTNLRCATRRQQLQNRRKVSKAQRYKGVRRAHSKACRYTASINHTHLGTFATEEEAARAYDVAALKYFGEFANLNFAAQAKGC